FPITWVYRWKVSRVASQSATFSVGDRGASLMPSSFALGRWSPRGPGTGGALPGAAPPLRVPPPPRPRRPGPSPPRRRTRPFVPPPTRDARSLLATAPAAAAVRSPTDPPAGPLASPPSQTSSPIVVGSAASHWSRRGPGPTGWVGVRSWTLGPVSAAAPIGPR